MIRKARLEDYKDLHYIIEKTTYETDNLSRIPGEYSIDVEEYKYQLAYQLSDPDYTLFVAEIDKKVVGMCELRQVSPRYKLRHRAEIGIKILEAYTNQGQGRKLMEAALEEADQKGNEMITLSCMKANHRAIHLYSSLGFHPYGELTHAYKKEDNSYQDEIFMVKCIEK